MYITRVPNRGSPPAVLLRESFRENGKVKTRTLANLSRWPEHKLDRLDRALRGLPPADWDLSEAFDITRSLPHGHVAAVLGTAEKLGIPELIDPIASRPRNLVLAMLIGQIIEPGSKLAMARGLRAQTATSTLGQILDVSGCDEDDLYDAMDWALQRKDGVETALAAVEAMRISQASARFIPAPAAGPFTAAMIGLGESRMARTTLSRKGATRSSRARSRPPS